MPSAASEMRAVEEENSTMVLLVAELTCRRGRCGKCGRCERICEAGGVWTGHGPQGCRATQGVRGITEQYMVCTAQYVVHAVCIIEGSPQPWLLYCAPDANCILMGTCGGTCLGVHAHLQ